MIPMLLLIAVPGSLMMQAHGALGQESGPVQPANTMPPDIARIAAVLHVQSQVEVLLHVPTRQGIPQISQSPPANQTLGLHPELDLQAEFEDTQKLQIARNAVEFAAISAMTDINRTLFAMQRDEGSARMTAEEKAYRNTKFFNAFLGTTIGMVGSGLQFSKAQTVNYVGDGISVAGGAVSVGFALCTADVSERDNPPDFPPYWDQLPESVKTYLQTEPETYAVMMKPAPQKKKTTHLFSCHFEGGKKSNSVADYRAKADLLSKKLADMAGDIKRMQDAIMP